MAADIQSDWRTYSYKTDTITGDYDNYKLTWYTNSDATRAYLKKYNNNVYDPKYSQWILGDEWTATSSTYTPTWEPLTYTTGSTVTSDGFYTINPTWEKAPPLSPQARLREIIRSRIAPATRRRKHLQPADDIREVRARETLCRVVGRQQFQSFLRNGFISVRAKSGKVYQIFPGHGMTRVYKNGKPVEMLCVVLAGNFPPTDELIMRYLLILNDEAKFRGYANVSRFARDRSLDDIVDHKPDSLPGLFRKLKGAA